MEPKGKKKEAGDEEKRVYSPWEQKRGGDICQKKEFLKHNAEGRKRGGFMNSMGETRWRTEGGQPETKNKRTEKAYYNRRPGVEVPCGLTATKRTRKNPKSTNK